MKHWEIRTIGSIEIELGFFIPEEVEKFMKLYGKQLLEQTGRLNITGPAIVQGRYNYVHFLSGRMRVGM